MKFVKSTLLALIMANHGCAAIAEDEKPFGFFKNGGVALFSAPAETRKRRAYLLIDGNGKPAIYPVRHTGPELSQSETMKALSQDLKNFDIVAANKEWQMVKGESNILKVDLFSLKRTKDWDLYKVELGFKDDVCDRFRVSGPGIKVDSWISTSEVPKEIRTSEAGREMPPAMVCTEYPSDLSDCGRLSP